MLYEIINPSDPYTIECSNHQVATAACFLLGHGKYAFEPLDGSKELRVPIFLMGGHDEWCQEKFGMDASTLLEDVLKKQSAELIAAFESCLIGKVGDRKEFEEACKRLEGNEDIKEFKLKRHESKRSSLNDIGGNAYRYAEGFREELEEE